MFQRINILACVLALSLCAGQRLAHAEEFVGPFGSWADVKTHYGAVGDGVTDDTAALQAALNAVGTPGHSSVLYLPAGTYKITNTLSLSARRYIQVQGASPAQTQIFWAGPSHGTMFELNGVAYSSFGRITWNGANTAQTAIDQAWDGTTGFADTENEHLDEVFNGIAFGIRGGRRGFMDAECAIERCTFTKCTTAGVSVENWNALDWFIWDSYFYGCAIGVTNLLEAGGYQVDRCSFYHSTVSDCVIGNSQYFSFRGNKSVGSKCFLSSAPITNASYRITLQDNDIYSTSGIVPVNLGNIGPIFMLGNHFTTSGAAVILGNPNCRSVSIDNQFTYAAPITTTGSLLAFDNTQKAYAYTPPEVGPVATPINVGRTLIDLPDTSTGAQIQAAINSAVSLNGKRPVVHLPSGVHNVTQTITIPAGCDVQLVGDGNSTILRWTAATPGTILTLQGPSIATLRRLALDGSTIATGISATNIDQIGGRIYGDEADLRHATVSALDVSGTKMTNVAMQDFYHNYNALSINVDGAESGGAGGLPGTNCNVAVFCGEGGENTLSYSVANGGSLLVDDAWYEGGGPGFAQVLTGGSFTLHGANVSTNDVNHGGMAQNVPSITVDDSGSRATILETELTYPLALSGAGVGSYALMMGDQGPGTYLNNDTTDSAASLLQSLEFTPGGGGPAIPNTGPATSSFIATMLEQTRTETAPILNPTPIGTTDLRLFRVSVYDTTTALQITP